MKQDMKIIVEGLLIALIATGLDQLYHIAFSQPHQIFTFLSSYETMLYVTVKFFTVALLSFFILSMPVVRHMRLWAIVASIALPSAAIFGVIMSYLFPYAYDYIIHLAHGIAIGLATFVVLKYYKGAV